MWWTLLDVASKTFGFDHTRGITSHDYFRMVEVEVCSFDLFVRLTLFTSSSLISQTRYSDSLLLLLLAVRLLGFLASFIDHLGIPMHWHALSYLLKYTDNAINTLQRFCKSLGLSTDHGP